MDSLRRTTSAPLPPLSPRSDHSDASANSLPAQAPALEMGDTASVSSSDGSSLSSDVPLHLTELLADIPDLSADARSAIAQQIGAAPFAPEMAAELRSFLERSCDDVVLLSNAERAELSARYGADLNDVALLMRAARDTETSRAFGAQALRLTPILLAHPRLLDRLDVVLRRDLRLQGSFRGLRAMWGAYFELNVFGLPTGPALHVLNRNHDTLANRRNPDENPPFHVRSLALQWERVQLDFTRALIEQLYPLPQASSPPARSEPASHNLTPDQRAELRQALSAQNVFDANHSASLDLQELIWRTRRSGPRQVEPDLKLLALAITENPALAQHLLPLLRSDASFLEAWDGAARAYWQFTGASLSQGGPSVEGLRTMEQLTGRLSRDLDPATPPGRATPERAVIRATHRLLSEVGATVLAALYPYN